MQGLLAAQRGRERDSELQAAQCLWSAIGKNKRGGDMEKWMPVSHSAIKIHIENILGFDIPCL